MSDKANETRAGTEDFTRNITGMTGANLITKALGYARDALLVAFFGGGALADAYYAAFRLVNVFRRT
ncbi:MAG: murein biosynthesis integral membrane protein MurJ, partial [Elusimicrobia bacterium CG08_land_8_20_14_0_20_59_10]